MTVTVEHHTEQNMFSATLDGQDAGRLVYTPHKSRSEWVAYSTSVSPMFEGRGVGSALTLAAVEAAQAQQVKIVPTCWFVAGWLDRHSEFADVRKY
ncbi:MAG: N-acetyltransferase [Actinomycetia bacterium]|nr:N-acetyltransferase [Actinomycetes bacterium]